MIITFGTKETEKIFFCERVKKLPVHILQIGRRKLKMLHSSQSLLDIRIPPSNNLEKLKNSEFYSIRINDQWRIIFKWKEGNLFEVEIIDYH